MKRLQAIFLAFIQVCECFLTIKQSTKPSKYLAGHFVIFVNCKMLYTINPSFLVWISEAPMFSQIIYSESSWSLTLLAFKSKFKKMGTSSYICFHFNRSIYHPVFMDIALRYWLLVRDFSLYAYVIWISLRFSFSASFLKFPQSK